MLIRTLLILTALLAGGLASPSVLAQSVQSSSVAAENGRKQVAADYSLIFVNATVGSDRTGNGTQMSPLATITHALKAAPANSIIVLEPGEYSAETGEVFPLQLRAGVTVQGMPGPGRNQIVIRGGDRYLSPSQGLQNVAILAADAAGLGNVTVMNPHSAGLGLWIESGSPVVRENAFMGNGYAGVLIAGGGHPVIERNYFSENGEAGLVITGPSAARVEGNVFERTGTGIQVAPGASPHIENNRIVQNQDGIILQADARPQLVNNVIAQNRRNGLVEFRQAAQDQVLSMATPPVVTFQEPLPTTPPVRASEAAAPTPTTVRAEETAPTEATTPVRSEAIQPLPSSAWEIAAPNPPIQYPSFEPDLASGAIAPPAQRQEPEIQIPQPDEVSDPKTTPPHASINLDVSEDPAGAAVVAADPSARDLTALRQWLAERHGQAQLGNAEIEAGADAGAIDIQVIPPPVNTVARAQTSPAESPESLSVASTPEESISLAVNPPDLSSDFSLENSDSVSLQVPNLAIPVGQGGIQSVALGNNPTVGGPPAPPSRAAALGLHYKVLVDAQDVSEQDRLKAIVSDAFRVQVNGITLMQAGAYPDQATADELAERLQSEGFNARVEYTP